MRRRLLALFLLLASLSSVTSRPRADEAPAAEDPRRAEAKAHFERGVAHTDRGEWDAGLVEFLASRKALATSKNTYNAAVCLRKVSRFDEALEMYETLLRDFPDISKAEKDVAERELAQLKASVGAIELVGGAPKAKVVVDGRERGALPLSGPIRVGAGSHTIRVSAEGSMPFEARIDVAGMQTVQVKVELAALTAGGRLNVAEQAGRALDVVVDGATVGKTPWEGILPPGEHTVLLRGEGNLGTPPVRPNVTLGQVVSLSLLGEELASKVRIEPVPATSTLTLDGVILGRGAWEGRLRPGTHQLAATAEGFLPMQQKFVADKDRASVVPAALARDPDYLRPAASIAVELDAAMPLGAVFGGDVADACGGGCSSGLPFGLHGVLHGAYQLGSGLGFGADVGYLLAYKSISSREATLAPKGRAANRGTADDAIRLSGFTFGGSAHYQLKGSFPILFRLGAGVLLGSARDERTGSFSNSAGETYTVDAKTSAAATYLYVAPEIRVGRAIAKNFEVNLGVETLLMTALAKPSWSDGTSIVTSNSGRGDGLATFGDQSTAGSVLVLVAPGVGARYDF